MQESNRSRSRSPRKRTGFRVKEEGRQPKRQRTDWGDSEYGVNSAATEHTELGHEGRA